MARHTAAATAATTGWSGGRRLSRRNLLRRARLWNGNLSHTSTASLLTEERKKQYFDIDGFGYVRLAARSDPAAVAAKIPRLLDQHVNVQEDLGMPLRASKAIQVRLAPFSAAHLDELAQLGEMVPPGSRVTLYGLGVIGFLILLVACFNFTNLATARAMTRSREIALRMFTFDNMYRGYMDLYREMLPPRA